MSSRSIQTALFLVLGLVERRGGSTSLLKLGGMARIAPVLGVLFLVPALNLAGIPPMSGFLGKVGLFEAGIQDGSPLALALVAGGAITSLLTLYAVGKAWNLAFWRTPEQAHEATRSSGWIGADEQPVAVGSGSLRRHGAAAGIVRSDGADGTDVDVDEERTAYDRDESTSRDLYELLAEGALPTRLPLTMVWATGGLIAFSLSLTLVAGPLFAFTARAADDLLDPTPYISAVLPEGTP